ncbi:MAG: helix-turn-helix transcriptional regulator [Eubacteriales bacterium]
MINCLNESIKRLRIAQGLNQVEFAKLVGVTKQCVSNWENDNVLPSIEMLVKIADMFQVSTDYLLGRSKKVTLDVSDLTDEQIGHIALVIQDLSRNNKH